MQEKVKSSAAKTNGSERWRNPGAATSVSPAHRVAMPPRTGVLTERRTSSHAAAAKSATPSSREPRLFDPAAVRAHVSSFAAADNGRALWEALLALSGYFLCFFLPWWTLPLHGMFAMRVFVVCVHDTAHGALFSSPRLNALLGSLTAPLTGMTYGYWQSGHAYHHRHSNDLDFLQTSQTAPLTSRGFAKLPAAGRAVYRWMSVPINLVTTGAPLAIMVAQPLSAERALDWALQVAWWGALYASGWWRRYLAMGLMTSALGLVLFHAQHTFPECERSHGKTATPMGYHENAILGSSFLQLNEWFKCVCARVVGGMRGKRLSPHSPPPPHRAPVGPGSSPLASSTTTFTT
jgi:omega-6 fatty acid desaturase (delta-12 desaturase)